MNKPWQLCSDDAVWMFPPDISLSTVALNEDYYPDQPYESCLFFNNGGSEIACRYATKQAAIMGHEILEKEYGLKRCTELRI